MPERTYQLNLSFTENNKLVQHSLHAKGDLADNFARKLLHLYLDEIIEGYRRRDEHPD